MKSLFREFYPLDKDELQRLWSECLFVFDTNVLLRMFRYRENTVKYMFEVLEHFRERLWIPHQVGWEFQRNRDAKIDEGRNVYEAIIEELKSMENAIEANLNKLKDFGIHPAINLDDKLADLRQNVIDSRNYIKNGYEEKPLHSHYENVFNKLSILFDGKVGTAYTDTEASDLYKSGKQRYDKKIPPGFSDAKGKEKESEQCLYGDFFLWRQILDHAKQVQKPIILVTEDKKEDWWARKDGKIKGPLPALRAAFANEVGTLFYMYRIGKFLEWAPKYGAPRPDSESEKQIKEDVKNVGRLALSAPANEEGLFTFPENNDPPESSYSYYDEFYEDEQRQKEEFRKSAERNFRLNLDLDVLKSSINQISSRIGTIETQLSCLPLEADCSSSQLEVRRSLITRKAALENERTIKQSEAKKIYSDIEELNCRWTLQTIKSS